MLTGHDLVGRDARQRADARQGARRPLLTLQGKEHEPADEFGEGDIGAVAKLKDVMTGDLLLDADQKSSCRASSSPSR